MGYGNFAAHLHVLDVKNWEKWVTQMKVIFVAQDVCDMVKIGVKDLPEDATTTQGETQKKRDWNALFLIHQSVESKVFEKIGGEASSKATWD